MDDVDEVRLVFGAGRLAEARGIQECVLVSAEDLEDQSPSGPPLIVTVGRGAFTERLLKSAASLRGAQREVLIVSCEAPAASSSWLPAECIHVVGAPLTRELFAATQPPSSSETGEVEKGPPARRQIEMPVFSSLRLFSEMRPDPIGEAATRWNAMRQRVGWSLREAPIPEEGAYAWFGSWPLTQSGPAALVRFQPYAIAGVQLLQIETAIGQVTESACQLERVGSAEQESFAAEVTLACEPAILLNNDSAPWGSEPGPAVARSIILDGDPPMPLADSEKELAARLTLGTTGVYLHYLVPVGSIFEDRVGAAVEALVAIHQRLWELCTTSAGKPKWMQEMCFTCAAELVTAAMWDQSICGRCSAVGLSSDDYCGSCGASWR